MFLKGGVDGSGVSGCCDSASLASNTNTMFDIGRANPAEVHPLLEAWIQRDVAVQIFRSAGLDFDAEKKTAQSDKFRPVPLKATVVAPEFSGKRTLARHQLVSLRTQLQAALSRPTVRKSLEVRAHLSESIARIDETLKASMQRTAF